jgi:hypothetical protein
VVLGGTLVAVVLAGCAPGRPAQGPTAPPATLPAITMTSGGGFAPESWVWTIAPDGAWTFTEQTRLASAGTRSRTGRLTDAQRRELAGLANDPALLTELATSPGPCSVSDGTEERLQVGSVGYLANWCGEHRPHIDHLRERIIALTTR